MKKIISGIRSLGKNILYVIVDYLSAFACMGTVADTRVYFTLALIMLFFTIYTARKVFGF